MRVVPVSIADIALVPVEIVTTLPLTVRPVRVNSQNVGSPAGILMNSISPVKSDEFVPPRVNTPPGARSAELEVSRASQNDISGLVS